MPAHREGRRAVNASFQSGKPGSVLSTLRAFGSIGTTEGLRYISECRAKAALPQSLCRLCVTSRTLRSFNPGPTFMTKTRKRVASGKQVDVRLDIGGRGKSKKH